MGRNDELLKELQAGEARNVEFKSWLNLNETEHIAILVKSLIAMYHENGGRIYVGIKDNGSFDDPPMGGQYQKQYQQNSIIECVQQYCNFPCDIQIKEMRSYNRRSTG